jgi:hypothetical protein
MAAFSAKRAPRNGEDNIIHVSEEEPYRGEDKGLTVNISPSSLSASSIGVSPASTATSNGAGSVYYWIDSTTTVTLKANTISGYSFSKWSGGASGTSTAATVKMSGPISVKATYTK